MELKPGYKQTEIGVIPVDWEVATLQQVCRTQITYGIVQCGPHIRDGVPYVRVSDFDSPMLKVDAMLRTSPLIASRFMRSTVEVGDLVYALRGKLGEVRTVTESIAGANLTQGTARLSPAKVIDSDYFVWAMRVKRVVNQANLEAKGTTFREITLADLRRLLISLPPLPEQKAIAQALSDMDALISGLDDLIAKKRDIKQATMQQLLTGKTRLPGFSGEWEVKRLGDVAILKSGYSFRSEDYSLLGNFKIVTIANVQSGYMTLEGCQSVFGLPTDLQSHQRLNVGDILISMTGNVGRVCRVTEPDCLLNQRVGKILHVGIDEDFLFTLLGQQSFLEEMTKKAKGGAQPNLSNADITEYRIRIPNNCSEQQAIAKVLTDLDAELEALEQRRDKTRELKQAVMQELLTGRTRLV